MLQNLKNIYHLIVALAANLWFGFPSRRLTVIGVTGTDGKTTTATLIYHLLKTANKKVALITSVAAYIGKEEIDTGFHVTTPNSWALQKLVKQIVDKKYDYLVLEVTSHGLDQHRLWGINFEIGVLTNITHEHLDYHKTYDSYLKTKAKLFRYAQHAVLNQDDSSFAQVRKLLSVAATVHPYSLSALSLKLLASAKQRFAEKYNQSNAAAAITAAQILGISETQIISAIKTFPGVKGRMEEIPNTKGITAIVDFAHTPNALEQALKALKLQATSYKLQATKVTSLPRRQAGLPRRQQASHKLIAVYGCAGLRDYRKRPLMGDIGSKLADIVIFTAEDPRTEDVNQIISQMKSGVTGKAKIIIEPDRQKAINQAVALAQPGDIVAAFGKGHEQSMCFGTIEYPWSDHDTFKQALNQK